MTSVSMSEVVPGWTRLAAERRLERDLEVARRIQRGFLPSLPPTVGGFRVAAEYRPAFDVGGDFYDIHSDRVGLLSAVIGDVSGKGVSAALLMSRISSEVRRYAPTTRSPEQLLGELNRRFSSDEDHFVTAACVELDAVHRRVTVANAGHVVPLIKRASGPVLPLGGASGPPIGMLPQPRYGDDWRPLAVGDIVLLMTDGVPEALHTGGDALGMWRLLDLIARAPRSPAEINRRILDAVDRQTHGAVTDDVTLLAIEVTAQAALQPTY
jgi:serine phosphatase RsbU (regulator of sigma subunit)